jgi:hypothetical protein
MLAAGLGQVSDVASARPREIETEDKVITWAGASPHDDSARCNIWRSLMKNLALAAVLSLAATSAFADSAEAPVMEATAVERMTASSAGGVVVPLLILLVLAAAVAN